MNRADRRAAAKQIAQQLGTGAVDLAELAATPKTLFLAYAAGENVRTLWHQSLLACAARSSEYGFLLRPRLCESGPHLSKARNLLVKSFLESEDPYLLFVDTDIVFTPQDVKLLLAADAPIAGALYFTAAAGMEPWPVALVEADPGEASEADGKSAREVYVPISLPEPPEDFDETDPEQLGAFVAEMARPVPVAAVGCGLMLIRRDVVEAVAAAHEFPFEYLHTRGEDVTFCLRAGELGFETVLVRAARVGHVKATVL